MNAKPRRPWFRYSLRTFLAGMIALTIAIGWWSHTAERRCEAVAAINAAGGPMSEYDFRYSTSHAGRGIMRFRQC